MEHLPAKKLCETCGSSLDFDMPSGFCPGCLLTTALESSETAAAGSHIEDYELLNEIARGGMGIVYRGRQRAPSRVVALKMILPAHVGSLGAVNRFRAEAEAAASLDYEGILPIYAVGEHNGAPFYSMKFAEGGTLSARINNYRDRPRDAAALIAKLAGAVAFAHENGILHRDLKPGNVLFDATGKAYVSDFGLAKWLQRECDLTQTLAILGTPYYMAPEQATDSHGVTAAADIYSLGAILYHLLTGNPPFTGDTPMEVLHRAEKEPPKPPRLTNQHVSRDLETICLKCLAKEPATRYASAAALAEDLERWLKHQPIQAKRSGFVTQGRKWVRRNPTTASLATALVTLAAAAGVMIWKTEFPQYRVATSGIAVLPFENLSAEENAFFADGVQDQILTDLSRIADLKVISRTSVMTYKSGLKRNLRQIANELGVTHVVEGSVQRAGNRVRVNAQLIDARKDAHLWGQTYDRDLADVFAIQSDIAKSIAEQLQARLSLSEKNAIERPPTNDVSAFDLYSRANNLVLDAPKSSTEFAEFLKAVDLLNAAVARDPSFFQAYCQLAHVHLLLYFYAYDHTAARLALAEAAVQAASRLRPDAGETHIARALNLYRGYLDYDGALAELELARRTLPNNSSVFFLMAAIQRRQGRWQECIQNLEHSSELDPRNVLNLRTTAATYAMLRRYAEEKSVLDRILVIEPDDPVTKAAYAFAEFNFSADTRPLRQLIDSIRGTSPNVILSIIDDWLACALAERDPAAVKDALQTLGERPVFLADENILFNPPFVEGVIARMVQDNDKARSAFRIAREAQEKVVQAQPNYGPALCVLGLIDAGLGRKEEALREGQRAVELLPVRKDALGGMHMVKYLAMIAAWVGDNDLACEQLGITIHNPSSVSYGELKLMPWWDPLRGEPCFEKIVASLAPSERL